MLCAVKANGKEGGGKQSSSEGTMKMSYALLLPHYLTLILDGDNQYPSFCYFPPTIPTMFTTTNHSE